jgi:hypothetical protein
LQDYSEKVRKRIKHFNKGYHDERRAKETAMREAQELQQVVANLLQEKKNLSLQVHKSETTMLTQAKATVERDLEEARSAYREAHAAGDSDALLEAEERLSNARRTQDRLNNLELSALQEPENEVQSTPTESVPRRGRVQPDEKALSWQDENPWFGKREHEPETAFALGVHKQLTENGIDPNSNRYYDELNSRMQKTFPDLFEGSSLEEGETVTRRKATNVVAPATRTQAPRKIRLSKTQLNIASKLGLSPQQYAAQVALEMRKEK